MNRTTRLWENSLRKAHWPGVGRGIEAYTGDCIPTNGDAAGRCIAFRYTPEYHRNAARYIFSPTSGRNRRAHKWACHFPHRRRCGKGCEFASHPCTHNRVRIIGREAAFYRPHDGMDLIYCAAGAYLKALPATIPAVFLCRGVYFRHPRPGSG